MRKAAVQITISTKATTRKPTAPRIPHGGLSGSTGRGAGRAPSFTISGKGVSGVCGVSTPASVRDSGEEIKKVVARPSGIAQAFARRDFGCHQKRSPCSPHAYAESVRGEQESDDGLRVFDLVRRDQFERAGEGEADDLDYFVILAMSVCLAQVGGEEDPELFVAEAGRRVEFGELFQATGGESEFLFEFARGGLFGALARVELARGKFEREARGRAPVLSDERDRSVVEVRDRRRAAGMPDDL